jgi:hypothetical protein
MMQEGDEMQKATTVVLTALFLSVLGATAASADPAVIIRDSQCGMIDGDGNSVTSFNTQALATQSETGVTVLQCKIKDVANNAGQAVRWDFDNTGSSCGIAVGGTLCSTTDWHNQVSKSGNATLICKCKD